MLCTSPSTPKEDAFRKAIDYLLILLYLKFGACQYANVQRGVRERNRQGAIKKGMGEWNDTLRRLIFEG